jgi:hypothetical protein
MALRVGWTNVANDLQIRYEQRRPKGKGQSDAQYQAQWATWFQALQNQFAQDISQNIAGYIKEKATHKDRTISVAGRFVIPMTAVQIFYAIGETATQGDYSVAVQSFQWPPIPAPVPVPVDHCD